MSSRILLLLLLVGVSSFQNFRVELAVAEPFCTQPSRAQFPISPINGCYKKNIYYRLIVELYPIHNALLTTEYCCTVLVLVSLSVSDRLGRSTYSQEKIRSLPLGIFHGTSDVISNHNNFQSRRPASTKK